MPTLRIVETFNVVEDIGLGFISRSIKLPCRSFGLERGEEALHRRIVPHVACPAHGADDAVISHQPLELFAGVLAAPIGVMQQRIGPAASPDRHHQGVGDVCFGPEYWPLSASNRDPSQSRILDDGSDI